MGSFFSREIHFPVLSLVVLFGILRLVLSLCLEYSAISRGVDIVFTMERAIQQRIFFMTFHTMFVLLFELWAPFLHLGVTVLVVSARLQCFTKVSRYLVSRLKP